MTVKTWPTLYKFNKNGSVQEWTISTEVFDYWPKNYEACYTTRFGRQDGKIQTTVVEVAEGKNIGKKNEIRKLKRIFFIKNVKKFLKSVPFVLLIYNFKKDLLCR